MTLHTDHTDPDAAVPLACVPGAIATEERPSHFALIARLFGQVMRNRTAEADGYAFHFPPEAFDDVARFVANERKCCPFLTFELTVSPPGGAVVLRLTGPEGTRAFLDAEFPS